MLNKKKLNLLFYSETKKKKVKFKYYNTMSNNQKISWAEVVYKNNKFKQYNEKKPILDKPILNKPILDKPILDKPILDKPIINKPILVNKNKKWRYLTSHDYTLTKEEKYLYEKLTTGMQCNCICCDDGRTATKILGRIVVACQRCFCCCGDDAGWDSDRCYAISKNGNVEFIGKDGKLPN